MDKTYQHKAIESELYQWWKEASYFRPTGEGDPYCIMLPPPNVTGTLHMGHGFQYSLMDALIRYHRMMGRNTLWQGGLDHAGIATQMVVERKLLKQGIKRKELGREKFIEKIWEWKKESGGTITGQFERMGIALDWSRMCFTMDAHLVEAVKEAFIRLYEEGLIYRGNKLVNWDPVLHTAISDLEVESEEEKSSLWHIEYPLSDGSGALDVATTRPETMLGDAAVAVHPSDDRYKKHIGKMIKLPLTNREIPVIADEYVDPEFGTGCVKITPAHDFNDYAVGQRHDLPLINIFDRDANLNKNVPPAYQGLDRFEARKRVLKDLEALGLLVRTEPHTLKVPRGDRTHSVIEPWLTNQWFVKMQPLAQPAIKAVEEGRIRFMPAGWENTYFQWLRNIEDWCISRQLWWGHQIPAWYDKADNIYVGYDEAEVRRKYKIADDVALQQDEDVLDTWFSSALWPFSTLGWPEKTPELKIFYPTNVLVSAFDIIFFWVARMIMFGIKFTGDVPFRDVYMTGLIRDSHGKKMSKSKGNVLDPIDLIDGVDLETLLEKRTQSLMQPQMIDRVTVQTKQDFPEGIKDYGTDALRLTFCALASTSRDINFDMNRLEGYRNFCNKLWNAARFALSLNPPPDKRETERLAINRWIISKLQKTIRSVHENFEKYRFDLLTQSLYDFTWHEYCDWYLEFSKTILRDENASDSDKQETHQTLLIVLENLLQLWHPIIPFITEAIWQEVRSLKDLPKSSILLTDYPKADNAQIDDAVENEFDRIKAMIMAVRQARLDHQVSFKQPLSVYLKEGDDADKKCIEKHHQLLKRFLNLEKIEWAAADQKFEGAAEILLGRLMLIIPLPETIDRDAQQTQIQKQLDKLKAELQAVENKLNNPDFVQKAPPEIVEKERERLEDLKLRIQKLR